MFKLPAVSLGCQFHRALINQMTGDPYRNEICRLEISGLGSEKRLKE